MYGSDSMSREGLIQNTPPFDEMDEEVESTAESP